MTNQINKKILFSILVFVSFVLIAALVIEYGLDHQACKLCLYERIPYFISIILILIIFFTKGHEKNILLMLFIIFVISSILAFYHFGIEQGFFKESIACSAKDLSEEMIGLKYTSKLIDQMKNKTLMVNTAV